MDPDDFLYCTLYLKYLNDNRAQAQIQLIGCKSNRKEIDLCRSHNDISFVGGHKGFHDQDIKLLSYDPEVDHPPTTPCGTIHNPDFPSLFKNIYFRHDHRQGLSHYHEIP